VDSTVVEVSSTAPFHQQGHGAVSPVLFHRARTVLSHQRGDRTTSSTKATANKEATALFPASVDEDGAVSPTTTDPNVKRLSVDHINRREIFWRPF